MDVIILLPKIQWKEREKSLHVTVRHKVLSQQQHLLFTVLNVEEWIIFLC